MRTFVKVMEGFVDLLLHEVLHRETRDFLVAHPEF